MSFGKRLRELREKNGWTLQQVADKLGLNVLSTYSNWEYGRTTPGPEMLQKVAELYQVDMRYLWTGRRPETIDYGYDLRELLNGINLKWGDERLTEDEKNKAIEILNVLLAKK